MISDLRWVNDPAAPKGWLHDRWGVFNFEFIKHVSLDTLPAAAGCYLLVDDRGRFPYVGVSQDLRNRLDPDHEVVARAQELGLVSVLVHAPHPAAQWKPADVEAIMYDRFRPWLNRRPLTPPHPYDDIGVAELHGDWVALQRGMEQLRQIADMHPIVQALLESR
ncbi:MAG: hypothetical protein RIB84_23970 [Sneathiellaceae bacterium]